ncbi:MAG: prmt6 [Microbacteriaceae bacterium]|jgi:SAM-dependent methyltransferase|nr:prmt6 [Microbacteriaceae bacterium]
MSFYDGIEIHRRMVGDDVRTGTFHASIAATVRPGDVVLDVGAGSGILSLFAAQAGAARVYGIERATAAAALARRIIADNGLDDWVQILDGDAEVAVLPEPVDLIVSEWCGVFGVDENMLAPVLAARDRWLKPTGTLIPGAVTAWIAPVFHPAGVEATAFRSRSYGFDLTALAPFGPDEAVWLPDGVTEGDLQAEPKKLWVTDPATLPAAYARQPFASQLTFDLRGPVNGLAAWFSAEMPGAAQLTNAPGSPLTHWGQFLFPIANTVDAVSGDQLHVGFHCVPSPLGASQYLWSSQVGDGALEVHDTRRVARPPAAPPWRIYLPTR